MELSDDVLWRRSQRGDAEAFGFLFDRHSRTIYNFCFRLTADWAIAEDLMSVAFLEAWRRRETSLPTDKVLPWLFGIAMNVVRNHQRSQRRFLRALLRTPLPQPEPSFDERTDERLDDEAQMRSALQALSGLPKREQDVFVLCAWSGLSYEDAALALDVPVGTIRSRLSRARARLLELEPDFGHEESTTRPVQEAVEP